MNKEKLKNYFSYHYLKYIIVFLLIIVFWSWLTKIIVRPTKYESFNIFIGSEDLNINNFNEYKESFNLKKINISIADKDSEMFNTLLEVNGVVDGDILILNIDSISNEFINYRFISFKSEHINQYINSSDFYTYNNKNYGIHLIDDYYVFFNKKSVHLGDIKDNSYSAIALEIVKIIIEDGLIYV